MSRLVSAGRTRFGRRWSISSMLRNSRRCAASRVAARSGERIRFAEQCSRRRLLGPPASAAPRPAWPPPGQGPAAVLNAAGDGEDQKHHRGGDGQPEQDLSSGNIEPRNSATGSTQAGGVVGQRAGGRTGRPCRRRAADAPCRTGRHSPPPFFLPHLARPPVPRSGPPGAASLCRQGLSAEASRKPFGMLYFGGGQCRSRL